MGRFRACPIFLINMEKDKYLEKAIELAKAVQCETAKYIMDWKGYRVYVACWKNPPKKFGGKPTFILANKYTIRYDKDEETDEILISLP